MEHSNENVLNILLVGPMGKMGTEIRQALRRFNSGDRFRAAHRTGRILGGMVREESPMCGSAVADISFPLSSSWNEGWQDADVIIDFSTAEATPLVLELARDYRLPLVLGTTGLDAAGEEAVRVASGNVPILRARNTSLGIAVLNELVSLAASSLGKNWDAELVELHHRMKRDAPSGTAITLLETLAAARHESLLLRNGREGLVGARPEGEIAAHAVRGGDIVGEHTVYFISQGERIELTHRATSRSIFADGALLAAEWLVDSKKAGHHSGYFTMRDVCGLAS